MSDSLEFITEEHRRKHPSLVYYNPSKFKTEYGKLKKAAGKGRLSVRQYQESIRRYRLVTEGFDSREADYCKSIRFSSKLMKTIRKYKKEQLREIYENLVRRGRRRSRKLFEEARELSVRKSVEDGTYIKNSDDLRQFIEVLSPTLKT